jgi:hypothetical protein
VAAEGGDPDVAGRRLSELAWAGLRGIKPDPA